MAVVSTEWLDARAGDPDVRVIEVAMGAAGGPRIAGADRVNWKAFLWHATDRAFVTPDEAAARLGALGIGEGVAVVVAGDPVQFGTYAYWVLRMAGVAPLHLL
ncbi:MAG: sulfurtransferase, partial [Pseudomonadota bacterium]